MQSVEEKLKNISLLILDVDGVLTDGSITCDAFGNEIKRFNVQDGLAIKLWQGVGHAVSIISGRKCRAVAQRARELEITPVIQGEIAKVPGFEKILQATNKTAEQACMIGDDLIDLPVMKRCGISIAVRNAAPEVKSLADYTTAATGGAGGIREAIEWILKAQSAWSKILAKFE